MADAGVNSSTKKSNLGVRVHRQVFVDKFTGTLASAGGLETALLVTLEEVEASPSSAVAVPGAQRLTRLTLRGVAESASRPIAELVLTPSAGGGRRRRQGCRALASPVRARGRRAGREHHLVCGVHADDAVS